MELALFLLSTSIFFILQDYVEWTSVHWRILSHDVVREDHSHSSHWEQWEENYEQEDTGGLVCVQEGGEIRWVPHSKEKECRRVLRAINARTQQSATAAEARTARAEAMEMMANGSSKEEIIAWAEELVRGNKEPMGSFNEALRRLKSADVMARAAELQQYVGWGTALNLAWNGGRILEEFISGDVLTWTGGEMPVLGRQRPERIVDVRGKTVDVWFLNCTGYVHQGTGNRRRLSSILGEPTTLPGDSMPTEPELAVSPA